VYHILQLFFAPPPNQGQHGQSTTRTQKLKGSQFETLGQVQWDQRNSKATMVLLFVLAMALVASGVGATQPNFVILFGDDWGFGDMGANWNGTDGMPVDPKWPRALRNT
jgi:hypothetical protein